MIFAASAAALLVLVIAGPWHHGLVTAGNREETAGGPAEGFSAGIIAAETTASADRNEVTADGTGSGTTAGAACRADEKRGPAEGDLEAAGVLYTSQLNLGDYQYRNGYEDRDFNTEEYNYISENGYKSVMEEPLSTFSIDVDTASYSNLRRFLNSGQKIPADAVRIEEMLNYFSYDYPEPEGGEPFSVTTEYSDCPWNEDNRLLLIGIQAQEIDFAQRPDFNLVFLLDISGSMYSDDKLPLVQKAFTMLAENLTERDRVSIAHTRDMIPWRWTECRGARPRRPQLPSVTWRQAVPRQGQQGLRGPTSWRRRIIFPAATTG